MSTSWFVRCVTCKENMDPDCVSSLSAARAIVSLAPWIAAIEYVDGTEEVSVGHRNVDAPWLKRHVNHVLKPMDEYGNLDGACARTVRCQTCGHDASCQYHSGHTGPCSPGETPL